VPDIVLIFEGGEGVRRVRRGDCGELDMDTPYMEPRWLGQQATATERSRLHAVVICKDEENI
jgi:hypothetical protein